MTKQEWLKIKSIKQFPVSLFHEFYNLHKKEDNKEMNFQEFEINFQNYINILGSVPVTSIIKYYDNKLGVTKLYNKNSMLIKEY